MISKRLKSIADLITKSDKVIDIACDHALLDIYLVKEKGLNNIIVSDILESALNNAKRNIKKYQVEQNIIPVLSDGLLNIDTTNKNTIIISGLGTKTIIGILMKINEYNHINKLVIQANNDYYYLRSFLIKKKFYIENETIVSDNNKEYINIVFKKGKKRYSYQEKMFGPVLIKNKDNLAYFQKMIVTLNFINKQVPVGSPNKKYITKKIKMLNKIVKKLGG